MPDTPLQAAAPPAPKSWFHLLVGLNAIATVGVITAVLMVQFLINRPVNLTYHTTYLADSIESALEQFVPSTRVYRGEPQLREKDSDKWLHFRFEAQMPREVNPGGLKQLLREALVDYRVSIVEEPEGTEPNTLLALLDDREFARIRLQPAPQSIPEHADLRPVCRRIACEVARELTTLGCADDALVSGETTFRDDAETLWSVTPIQAVLPPDVMVDSLQLRLESRLAQWDVRVGLQSGMSGTATLNLAYAGKRCVELTCSLTKAAAALYSVAAVPSALPSVAPTGVPAGDSVTEAETVVQAAEAEPQKDGAAILSTAAPSRRARIAVILDDGGNVDPAGNALFELDPHLTLSILPNTPFARDTALLAAEKGFEVMLHMPMETHSESVNPSPGQVTTAMEKEEIQRLTGEALDQLPEVAGVNNHTGSKFTSDAEKMKVFLEVLKERALFFVDSRTTAASRAHETAAAMRVPTAIRDVFLDNEQDAASIRGQFEALVAKARERGDAIGIGHFRDSTVEVLAEELPKLAEAGIQLVHVSELLQ